MKYCRNCGKELNSDIQYCPNCGASVSEEQSGKNENSYQESNADGSLWESLVEFFKALIEYMKEAGLHIIDAIDKIIQMPPNIPKDSICPYCNSEDTFPIVKNETEIKTKGYSMGRGCCGMCLLGPFGLLCGALFTGSKVKSRSITWWGCKNCGRQHLAQHDAVETLSSLMDKMTVNCLCYGALGSLLLYPILDELVHENKFCPYCGASVQPEQNGEQPEQSAQPEQKSEQPEQSAQPEQKNEQPKQSAQPEQKSEQPKQSAQSDQRLTQKETTGNSSADVKNKGVSHPAPKKKKTAVVIGIIAMAAVIIIGIIAAVKMFGSSDAKETAKDSTYKEVKENAAEKESKPAKKENVKPKKETDGEMKKDSGQEEKKEEKDNSKREAVLTDPVTMGWAGTYKDDDSGDRLVIASIGYEWSYVKIHDT